MHGISYYKCPDCQGMSRKFDTALGIEYCTACGWSEDDTIYPGNDTDIRTRMLTELQRASIAREFCQDCAECGSDQLCPRHAQELGTGQSPA